MPPSAEAVRKVTSARRSITWKPWLIRLSICSLVSSGPELHWLLLNIFASNDSTGKISVEGGYIC